LFGESVAVRDFTVTVADGEFVTFLGPSGCGKTTCLRMVAGFIEPSQGIVKIGNRVVSDPGRGIFIPPEMRGVGMVFQSYAVWPHMKVFDNVAYPLKIKKVPRNEMRARVEEILSLTKMADLSDRYPHQLSGGQQQRVALARALIMTPEVLLLDEPLSNLDAKLREEMRIELKELQSKTGVTVIFVTHDQIEAMVMSDRVVVMHEGVIQQIGPPTEIYRQPANRFVADFIGVANFFEVERNDDGCSLAGDPRYTIPIKLPDSPAIGRLYMMVRPENIRIDKVKGDLPATIHQRLFLGDAIVYVLDAGKTRLRVKTGAQENFAPQEPVYLTLEQAHFFHS
ncbi:ABC transporter ATP-binding protein, partial [Thermodesulfobacteriota bacterium]